MILKNTRQNSSLRLKDEIVSWLKNPHWRKYATNIAVLFGAMLVAVQIRLKISDFGSTLYANYDAQSVMLYVLIAVAGILGMLAMRLFPRLQPIRAQYIGLLLGTALSFLAIVITMPDLSLLQLLYYVIAVLLLGWFVILWPDRLVKGRPRPDVLKSVYVLGKNQFLIRMWVMNNIRARYSQAILGILWIILLPMAQAAIMSIVFSRFIRMDVGDVPFISFFLAALIPWSFFNQSSINSASAVVDMMTLITQIYFPREILVLIRLGETVVDAGFMFLSMLIINLIAGLAPNVYFVYLPLLFFITIAITLGLSLFFSYLTVLIRDTPQLLFVILQLLFYLTPIMYPVTFIPPEFRFLALLNPLLPLIEAYREIIVYGRPPDFISLHYPLVIGLALLYVSYTFFKANEKRLADYL